jgi:bifunctional N-acetylglucosamine-1-phosphate-uridyltransferase/glucosamine-1-phosphate-acetyltransferase GlmU-like protein
LATEVEDPTRYGRILLDADGRVTAIVEESDASEAQKRINTINTGIYCIKNNFLHDAIPKIQADNVQGEFYLTDIIEIAYRARMTIGMRLTPDPVEVAGINTLQELQRVERILGERTSNKP